MALDFSGGAAGGMDAGGSFFDSLGLSSTSIAGGFGAAGLATSLAGGAAALSASTAAAGYQSQAALASGQIAKLDEQVNAQKQQQMVLNTQRQQMENLRNVQRTKAAGLATATAQGAQFGSGLAGAQGAETAQGATNALNTQQNLQIGQNIFGLTNQEDQQKILIAQYESQAATAQGQAGLFGGISQLGSGLLGGALSLGKLLAL